MKRLLITAIAIGSLRAIPVSAQVPADPAPKAAPAAALPPATPAPGVAPAPIAAPTPARPVKKEKVVSLGVDVSQASPTTRDQLKLPRGVGLNVDAVHNDGPAKAADIQQHDVLEKLNDQWLVNPQQFYTLCRGMKAGDEVTLSLIRQGERKTVKAKLEEREQPIVPLADGNAFFDLPGGGDGLWRTTTVLPNGNVMTTVVPRGGAGGAGGPARGRDVMAIRTLTGNTQSEWADDQFTILLRRKGGDKVDAVTVIDKKTGKMIFNGKKDDLEKQVTPDVLEKVKQAEKATIVAPAPVQIQLGAPPQFNEVLIENAPGAANGVADRTVVQNWVRGGGGAMTPGFRGDLTGFVLADTAFAGGRGKVMRWQDDNHILFLRALGKQPIYLLALSTKDGRVVYDGPVQSEDQRKSVPAEVSEEFEMLVAHPEQAKEFGATATEAKPDEKPKPTDGAGGGRGGKP